AAGTKDPMDLSQGLGDRGEVAEHIRGEDTVETAVAKRQLFAHRRHPMPNRAETQHLDDWVQGDDISVAEYLQRRSGAASQVENAPGRKVLGSDPTPLLFPSERQHPVDAVVSAGDPSEDPIGLGTHCVGGWIRSKPV